MEAAGRCPNCGALVMEGAEWCTLCFSPLGEPASRTAPETAPEAGEPEGGEPGAPDPSGGRISPLVAGPLRIEIAEEREGEESSGGHAPDNVVHLAGGTGIPSRGSAVPAESAFPAQRPDEDEDTGDAVAEMVWECPVCETENPFTLDLCSVCGTPFGRLFKETKPEVVEEPSRAATFGVVPGLGHWKCGRGGEAFARAALAVATLLMLGLFWGTAGPPGILLKILFFVTLIALIAESSADAYRLASGEDPIVQTKLLVYGWAVVFGISVVMVVVLSIGAQGQTRQTGEGGSDPPATTAPVNP